MGLPQNWIKPLARAGYSARGLVYLIVGLFAVLAAFGAGEKKDSRGALHEVLAQPFGTVLTSAMIAGLVGYVIWRLIQSVFDTDDHGLAPKGLAVRLGLLAGAFTYATLALYALSLLGVFSGGGGGGGRDLADSLARIVGAHWVSLGLSLVFAGIAAAHWWKAALRKYERHFAADQRAMAFVHPVSIVSLAARGFVFAIIAIMLFYRFLSTNGGEGTPPGLKDALAFVQDLPFGSILLSAMGLGLIAFAAYSFAEAKWRRINVENA